MNGEGEPKIVRSVGEIDPGALIGFELQVVADESSRQLALAIQAETGLGVRDLAQIVSTQERRNTMLDGGRIVRPPGVRPRSERRRYTPLAVKPSPTTLIPSVK